VYLEAFSDNPFDTNCWLLAADGSEEAVVVDPGFSAERVLRLLEAAGKRPVAAVATHGHSDHIGAAEALCGNTVPFHIHKEDEQALFDPAGWGSQWNDTPVRPGIVRTFADGDVVDVGGFQFEVIHTPGHTPGSSCFRIPELLFSGDLVFAGAIGRSDFANSSPTAMVASLRRFLELPDDLVVHPGHGPSTTVGEERRRNPFLLDLQ
jgi:glyoxylase-like metal-dependent hydrolase (beta-lactamase superfamily II)